MSEKYQTMSVAELRAILKERGAKNISALRKAHLVQLLDSLDGAGASSRELSGQSRQRTGQTGQQADRQPAEERQSRRQVDRQTVENRPMRQQNDRLPAEGRQGQRQPVWQPAEERQTRRQVDRQPAESRPIRQQADRQPAESRSMRQQADRQPAESRPMRQQADRQQSDGRPARRQTGWQQTGEQIGRQAPRQQQNQQPVSDRQANGILEVIPEGYGFIRCENYLSGENDVYVSHTQIRRFNLKTGDIVCGDVRDKLDKDRYSGLLYVRSVNGLPPEEAQKRANFEDMTPIFPNRRINLETPGAPAAMRLMNLISPIGCGQRGMIVSPPKTGKTTLIKQVARAIHTNYPDMNMIILLIDERPEEVTDIKEYIEGDNVEVIYSTFDELPEHHQRVSEMVLERAKRLVEHKKDVVILLDSITRLARACNLTVQPSGRTLTGGLDPAALYLPKRFFGSARNMREGGSLTVLATALVETGSKMDDVVFEEFKGTGNMELVLDRRLSEKRVFPAINIPRSGTRREDLLLTPDELEAMYSMRRALGGVRPDESLEQIMEMLRRSENNEEFVRMIKRTKVF